MWGCAGGVGSSRNATSESSGGIVCGPWEVRAGVIGTVVGSSADWLRRKIGRSSCGSQGIKETRGSVRRTGGGAIVRVTLVGALPYP